jgi:alkyl sulfatase BDS1-like metallo-beta-lactamase superfamily hydrolase
VVPVPGRGDRVVLRQGRRGHRLTPLAHLGAGAIVEFLTEQRDLYAYLHDQTLRLLNKGYIGSEIAEMVELPPGLDRAWHTHGYYGSASHNIKAIYQRYLGWYDGNPAHLWQHPPEAAAARYVELLGGVDATVARAKEYAGKGDPRFAAELAGHAVFAAPAHGPARELLASVLERLGYGAENATWRNCYLTGARELRTGRIEPTYTDPAGLAPALTTTQLFDSVAIRVNGPKAWNETLTIGWHLTDEDQRYRMELSNGALIHHPTSAPSDAEVSIALTRPQLVGLLAGAKTDGVAIDGDASVLTRLIGLLDEPDPTFAVVTP